MKLKRYTVEVSNWYGGQWEDFWTMKGAVKCINENMSKWPWIDLIDNWKGTKNRFKNTDTNDYYRTEDGRYIKKDGK